MKEPLITPTKVVGGAIAIYEDTWNDFSETISDLVLELGDSFVSAKVVDTKTGKTYVNDVRNNDAIRIKSNSDPESYLKKLDKRCKELVDLFVKSYKDVFNISENILDREEYTLLRYSPGQYYHEHYDGGTETARSISVLIYLNDDYSGGEIEFVNFNEKIKPKAGTIILFPSNYAYRHIAHPVLSGTKYVIVTWLHDREKEF